MGFEKSHPAVNLIYFVCVITGMIAFVHPVYLVISFLCACVYSVKRNRIKALFFELALIPLAFIYAAYYASYHHFGMTELAVNFVGNRLTLESAVYGLVTGHIIAGVMIWSTCVFSVFTTDKVVYLLGALSPKLSLAASIILRMVPRSVSEARKINTARSGIGRSAGQGNIFRRFSECGEYLFDPHHLAHRHLQVPFRFHALPGKHPEGKDGLLHLPFRLP